MRLTVVGCSPAWPNPGGAHSGYLVSSGSCLLLDCGPGILSRLRATEATWPRIGAIVVSHWHLDHWGDLVPWVWGRVYGLGRDEEAPEVWVPPGGTGYLRSFGEEVGTPSMFTDAFTIQEYAEGEPFECAGMTVTAYAVPHYAVDSFAFRVTDGERTLAYSGDSAPSDVLAEVARDADLFLCEATLESGDLDSEPRGHLSDEEAVAAFGASGAKRLLLTHRPRELGVAAGLELAHDGLELDL